MTIKNLYPTIKPSLDLNFARSKTLDPRVTFSRASTASYYDGKTVAKAEENLLTYSQEFDNAAWVKASVTVVANVDIAPDGTLTADYLSPTSADSNIQRDLYPAGALPYVFSVWLKSANGSNISTQLTCTRFVPYAVVQSQPITVTSTWQRFTLSFTALDTSGHSLAIGRASTLETGENLLIWGAQLEQRSSATAYTPTTSAPITNYLPALQYAASNVPRFDHDPITGESKGLLIEEQRTNLLTYSSEFDNAAWSKGGATVTANTAIAPDGSLTADKLIEDVSSAEHFAQKAYATSGSVHTFSAYVKAAERSWVILRGVNAAAENVRAWFNVGTGTVGTVLSGATASIVSVGNGWFRCIVTISSPSTSAYEWRFSAASSDRASIYQGDGYSGVYIWGAQLEARAFPTSYIPTTTAQVTRAADSASMTGVNFSSWYRQDEGSLVLSYNTGPVAKVSRQVAISADGGISNLIQFGISSSGVVFSEGYTNGSAQFGATQSAGVANTVMNAAIGYATNNTSVTYSGATPVVDTSCIPPVGANRLDIGSQGGSSQANSCIKRIAYYPKRLTDSQLQQLTQ